MILRGKGATEVWNEATKKNTFEWQEGSLFAVPLNACHQHFNGSAGKPVRYLSVTDAPLVLNRFRNLDFVFNCPFNFIDRYDSSPQYLAEQGKEYSDAILKTDFVPDVQTVPLVDDLRVGSHRFRRFHLANGTMSVHIAEIPPGQYCFARTGMVPARTSMAGRKRLRPHLGNGDVAGPARCLAFHFNIRVSEFQVILESSLTPIAKKYRLMKKIRGSGKTSCKNWRERALPSRWRSHSVGIENTENKLGSRR